MENNEENGFSKALKAFYAGLSAPVLIIIIAVVILLLIICSFIYITFIEVTTILDQEDEIYSDTITVCGGNSILALPISESTISVTSLYGYRDCPFHGYELHSGLDLVGYDGCNILAAADGEVIVSMYSSSYGNTVVIKHTIEYELNGETITDIPIYTRYAHMKETPLVNVGDTVVQGQVIGYQGSTGNSTGSHLHFEVGLGGYTSDYTIDPTYFLGITGIVANTTYTIDELQEMSNIQIVNEVQDEE